MNAIQGTVQAASHIIYRPQTDTHVEPSLKVNSLDWVSETKPCCDTVTIQIYVSFAMQPFAAPLMVL